MEYQGEVKANISLQDLCELQNSTLGTLLSALIPHCNPSQQNFPYDKGNSPPWWPKGDEEWFDQLGVAKKVGPPPFKRPHDLRKAWKVIALASVIKHLSYDFGKIRRVVFENKILHERMSARENSIWAAILEQEEKASKEQLQVQGNIVDPKFLYFNNGDNYYDVKGKDYNVVLQKRKQPCHEEIHNVTTYSNLNCTCMDSTIGFIDYPPPLGLIEPSKSLPDDVVSSGLGSSRICQDAENDSDLMLIYKSGLEMSKRSKTSAVENIPTIPSKNQSESQQDVNVDEHN